MATTGYGIAVYKNGGVGDSKRPFQTGINEEAGGVSQEAGRNNSTGVSELSSRQGGNSASGYSIIGISELEQMLKQMTFTRSEAGCLIAVLHSRTIDEPPDTNVVCEREGSLKKHKHEDEGDNVHATLLRLEKGTGQTLRQDSELFIDNATRLPKTRMASPRHPTTMENLPEELLVNIFIRLLAKQVARMRSVSKSWNALLSQSSFVKFHLHHSIHNNDQILLVFYFDISFVYYDEPYANFEPFSAHSRRSPHLKLTNLIKLPVNPQPEDTSISVIGSVNGLICSSYGNSVIHIWNPSLSAMLTLPPHSMPYGHSYVIFFQFGFDPITDDYKVVKLVGLTRPHTGYSIVKEWLQVELYSMRKGSWKLITERFPLHITYISEWEGVCADGHDGHVHWLGYIGEELDSERIVAFDLGSETFHEMPLPDSTLHSKMDPETGSVYQPRNYLGVLGGKLCVMSWCGRDGCDVWVMDEYGVAESWVKRHNFSEFIDHGSSYGFTLHNEFLTADGSHVVLYGPVSNKPKILEINGHGPNKPKILEINGHGPYKFVEYVDSLVWVAPAEREMVDGA